MFFDNGFGFFRWFDASPHGTLLRFMASRLESLRPQKNECILRLLGWTGVENGETQEEKHKAELYTSGWPVGQSPNRRAALIVSVYLYIIYRSMKMVLYIIFFGSLTPSVAKGRRMFVC
uniref:Uncharacterized protein n=1 Tax=Anthoceros punctatus TaxID=3234 RepID=A0A6M8AYC0_ANTPU|nr:hypothetical protein [Anthoceros punctatus]QKD76592.1 hypothetical protein [Anthoceros punctatus]